VVLAGYIGDVSTFLAYITSPVLASTTIADFPTTLGALRVVAKAVEQNERKINVVSNKVEILRLKAHLSQYKFYVFIIDLNTILV